MKKSTSILRGLNDIRASYILESEIPDAAPSAAALNGEGSSRGVWRRITSSGWFAAAVCAIVAGGVLTGIILAGQNGPGTVSPAGTVAPPPITETPPIEEETSDSIPPYTEGLEYKVLSPTLATVSGIGSATDATVIHIPPTDEEGRDVLGIEANAFAGNTSITEVIFTPSGKLGGLMVYPSAFENCTSLQRIQVCDKKVKIIFSESCFKGCTNLAELDIPAQNNVTFASYALEGTAWLEAQTEEFVTFNGALLKYQGDRRDVVLPDTIRAIVGGAFENCPAVTSVTASDNSQLTDIINNAFTGASSLETVNIPNVRVVYGTAFDGCSSLKTVYLPASLESLGYSVPDCSATFIYTGTLDEWKQVTFSSDEQKAEWDARIIIQVKQEKK